MSVRPKNSILKEAAAFGMSAMAFLSATEASAQSAAGSQSNSQAAAAAAQQQSLTANPTAISGSQSNAQNSTAVAVDGRQTTTVGVQTGPTTSNSTANTASAANVDHSGNSTIKDSGNSKSVSSVKDSGNSQAVAAASADGAGSNNGNVTFKAPNYDTMAAAQVVSTGINTLPVWMNSHASATCDVDLGVMVERSTWNKLEDRDKPIVTPVLIEDEVGMQNEALALKRKQIDPTLYTFTVKTPGMFGSKERTYMQVPCAITQPAPKPPVEKNTMTIVGGGVPTPKPPPPPPAQTPGPEQPSCRAMRQQLKIGGGANGAIYTEMRRLKCPKPSGS